MAMLVLNDVFAKTWEQFPIANARAASGKPSSGDLRPNDGPNSRLSNPEHVTTSCRTMNSGPRRFLLSGETTPALSFSLKLTGVWSRDCKGSGLTTPTTKRCMTVWSLAMPPGAQRHLLGMSAEAVAGSAHFLENHDEPRIASILSPAEHRAAALLILGLPGMRFLHDGQLAGARRKLPVQLARRLEEPRQAEIANLYEQLLTALPGTAVGQGRGELLQTARGLAGQSDGSELCDRAVAKSRA